MEKPRQCIQRFLLHMLVYIKCKHWNKSKLSLQLVALGILFVFVLQKLDLSQIPRFLLYEHNLQETGLICKSDVNTPGFWSFRHIFQEKISEIGKSEEKVHMAKEQRMGSKYLEKVLWVDKSHFDVEQLWKQFEHELGWQQRYSSVLLYK